MKKTAICIAVLGFLCNHTITYAATLTKTEDVVVQQIPLPKVLEKLKTTTKTQFFYSVTDLEDIMVDDKKINYKSLDETLDFLKNNYPIDYSIQNNTVIIKRISKNDFTQKQEQTTDEKQKIEDFDQEIEVKEVVVVGYGKQERKNISGSISSINQKDTKDIVSGNFGEMIAGKATGIQVSQSNASPGSSPTIRIRGIGTLTAGSNPLIVVDGFPLTEGTNLNSIDPNSIETIDILKDAASSTIYGSRGANGVILIQTKQGKQGKMEITLDTYYGIQMRNDNTKLVNAYDMATFLKEARDNNYLSKGKGRSINDDTATRKSKGATLRELIPDYLTPYLNKEAGLIDTDWLNTIFRKASVSQTSLSITGGNEKSKYSFTGSYLNQKGIIIGTDYEKFSSNINLITQINDKLKIGFSINPMYSNGDTLDMEGGGRTYNLVQMATTMYPFFAPRDSKGNLIISQQIKDNTATDGALVENPVAIAEMTKRHYTLFKTFGNIYGELEVLKDIKYKLSIGGDYTNYEYNFFDPSNVGSYRTAAPDVTVANRVDYITKNYIVENLLTFDKRIGQHNFNTLLGQSFQQEDRNYVKISATGFPDNSIPNIAGGTSFKTDVDQFKWTLISYFGRLAYDYKNKYNVMASLRRDGSSRFGANSKWGNFYAFSLGWTISNENFFPKNNFINPIKFRYSYGSNGNNQIPNFGSLSLMVQDNYVFGGNLAPGYISSTAPNPDISWEKSLSNNFGIDFSLFRKFINISADYYVLNREGLLLDVPVPQQSGYTTSLQNIGKLRNNGLEIQIATKTINISNDFTYNGSLNFSTNKNKVLALANGQEKITTGSNNFSVTKVGSPIAEMYGYNITGIYKTQQEIDNSPHINGTMIGDYIMQDLNNDGKIDQDDKKSFGSGIPKYILAFNNSFKLNNWELNFTLYSELGRKVYNGDMVSTLESGEGFGMASQYYFDNRYNATTNPDGFFAMPNMNFSNNRKEARTSNLFFKDADYVRLRSIKLAYNLPKNLLSKLNIASTQIYFLGNNLLTITSYKGLNLDANTNNVLTQGYDSGYYPGNKVFSFGMNMKF
ncbi:MAG: SusC/RagA family TonB-linked outer membrane protein [Empedobacter falsenii]